MDTLLLATKNYIPHFRPGTVLRPELVNRVNGGLDRKLTLVSAPAGFGKTTMLSEWAGQCERSVGWVTLDEGDNDPTRFWMYVISAITSFHAGFGKSASEVLRSTQAPPLQAFLIGLINDIAETLPPFAVVLDDYHVINEPTVHDGVRFAIEHLPPQMHLVISTRSDPPIPISGLRGRRDLNELRTADLRFTLDETVAFIKRCMGLNLQRGDIELLGKRTEGWIVGLQLAALSIRGQADRHAFVTSLSGDNRYIADYLIEEVLKQQSDRVQEFLLNTSILDYLNGSLCMALTGFDDSNAMLVELEESNVFIYAMDQNRAWFRYHPLFADLLRMRLEQFQPDHTAGLHKHASLWFEEQHMPREAIKHALLIDDFDRAAGLLEDNAFDLINHGEIGSVSGWLDKLPAGYFQSHPWLNIAQAWTLVSTGELNAVETLIRNVESNFPELSDHKRFYGHCAAIRACVGALRGDHFMALKFAQGALENLPHREYIARGLALMMLGLGLRWKGELQAAVEAYSEAEEIGRKTGDIFIAVFATCYKGYALVLSGELRQGEAILRGAIQYAEKSAGRGTWKPPITGLAHAFLCSALLEWNEIEAAMNHARTGLVLSQKLGHTHAILDSYYFFISSLIFTGYLSEASEAISKARENLKDSLPIFSLDLTLLDIELHLAGGDIRQAGQLIEVIGMTPHDDISFHELAYYLAFAKVLWKKGNLNQTFNLLDRLLKVAEDAGARSRVIEILVMQALVLNQSKRKLEAVNTIGRALKMAEPEGFIWSFIRHGDSVVELLYTAAAEGIFPLYVGKLLAALDEIVQPASEENIFSIPLLPEPLSERELQVLRLLVAGMSSTEIAGELVIAVGTARTHIKHIYRKLDVHRRLEAIDRAKELKLV